MKASVFISRDLTTDSIFLKKLSNDSFNIHGESLIQFTPVPFSNVSNIDWIFFYSKNAVHFFFAQTDKKYTTVKYAAMGQRTAHVLSQYVEKVDFIGNGQPTITATAFLSLAKDKRILFPRAKNSRKSVQLLLRSDIEEVDLVVYDNRVKKDFTLMDYNILVFTSPMNVQAFFAKKTYNDQQIVVAIGRTTANALQKVGVTIIYIAKEASEAGLASAVQAAVSKRQKD